MYKIILASGSPRRKEIFEQVGIAFTVCSSDKEEIITKTRPSDIVMELADMKANDVAKSIDEEAIIIGADTLVALDGQVMGKPKNKEDAFNMIRQLQGKNHQVYTGVSIVIKQQGMNKDTKDKVINFYEVSQVYVNPMTKEQISTYISTDEPYDKAGAYGIQGIFAINIGRIEGDYYNIMGFPISKLYTVLLEHGIDILNN